MRLMLNKIWLFFYNLIFNLTRQQHNPPRFNEDTSKILCRCSKCNKYFSLTPKQYNDFVVSEDGLKLICEKCSLFE